MRFRQLDKILELKPGVEITAQRTLSDREGYFRDHFPRFPVMPGVLTLEAMYQAANWLVRSTDEFAHSVVVLKEVANVKFAGFARPGQTMTVSASIKKHGPELTTLATKADIDGTTVAGGRLVLERFNLADRYPCRAASDARLRNSMRAEFGRLTPGSTESEPLVPSQYRWMWIDRFTEFVRGQRAVAVKAVSTAEEPIDLYMPGFPVLPCSLMIEGFAQTGGILVGACSEFQQRIVLAKVSKAVFHRPAAPGDTVTYAVEVESLMPEGAAVRGTSRIGDALHAEVNLFFAYLDQRSIDGALIDPEDLLATLRSFSLYDIGRTEDGARLEPPRHMVEAEHAANTSGVDPRR